uniref:(northern house mosquito) hypothetical protein n=1 Tax=Culex pipiens TaxID=7175 RepID=A0A8D8KNV8_CULPI
MLGYQVRSKGTTLAKNYYHFSHFPHYSVGHPNTTLLTLPKVLVTHTIEGHLEDHTTCGQSKWKLGKGDDKTSHEQISDLGSCTVLSPISPTRFAGRHGP